MFDINKCATAVTAAMVGTIRNGDDAKRFAERAIAEGFNSISDLIGADAAKQALATRAALAAAERAEQGGNAPKITVHVAHTPEVITITGTPVEETRTAAEAFSNAPLAVPPAPSAQEQGSTTTTSMTMATASDVVLDSRGLPWDGRIHASTKTRLAKDDSWKLKRGLEPAYVEQIENELRQVMSIPNVSAEITDFSQAPTPPAPTETQGLLSVETVNRLTEQGNSVPPVAADTQPTGAPSNDYSTWGMPELMRGMTAKKCDQTYVSQVCQQFGIPSIMAVGARKDLIPLIAEALEL